MDEEDRRYLGELLRAILHRLREPIEVSVTIHVVNEAHPPVKLVLTPEQPKDNT
jgi:hypothetical protein